MAVVIVHAGGEGDELSSHSEEKCNLSFDLPNATKKCKHTFLKLVKLSLFKKFHLAETNACIQ